MAEPREIHLHLTAQPGTTVHVTIAGEDITVASDEAEPDTSISPARSEMSPRIGDPAAREFRHQREHP